MFDDILNQDLTKKEERLQNSCFEKCLGKHTDSFEVGLQVLTEHLKKQNAEKPEVRYNDSLASISGGDQNQPVYDAPRPKRKTKT